MVDCCIAGCGPAGAMLGLLLARAGLDVAVLEKHPDFLRDFRGDTIHPSTLEILDDLGLASRFLSEVPHSKVSRLEMRLASGDEVSIDFRGLPTRFPFIAFVPQWEFLRFVTEEARRYAGFRLMMQAEVVDLVLPVADPAAPPSRFLRERGEKDTGYIGGMVYRTPDGGVHELRAGLVVGADGRGSRVREAAELPLVETSPPMDVLWFRISRRAGDSESVGLRLSAGHFFGLINRREYWQVAYVISKRRV